MSRITLDKEHGLDPKMTYCPRCGGEANELVLPGTAGRRADKCNHCGCMVYGGAQRGKPCPRCSERRGWTRVSLNGNERWPASGPCDACEKEIAEFKEEVDKGGVYFQCEDCGSEGAIKASHPFALAVRKAHGERQDPPVPVFEKACGVTLSKDGEPCCPSCGGMEDEP